MSWGSLICLGDCINYDGTCTPNRAETKICKENG